MTTMNVSLADELKDFVDDRVDQRRTSTGSAGRSRPAAEVLPAWFRTKATNDVDEAVSFSISEAEAEVAKRFELDLPRVRSFRVDTFPHLSF